MSSVTNNVQAIVPKDNFRKVSYGHDNLGFDSSKSRKVSTASDHAETGPVHKKAALHNAAHQDNTELGKHTGGERSKKISVTNSLHSRTRFSDEEDENKSWWYTFCVKCRSDDSHPQWKPNFWNKCCPYPFCLSYRQFSRIIGISLIGLFLWGVVYTVVGKTAAPGGQLFQLIVLSITAHFGGWLITLTTLPALIGALAVGILFRNVGFVEFDDSFSKVTTVVRQTALVIILIRAGLDLDPHALKKLKVTVPKLGIGPWLIESLTIAVLTHYIMDLPWEWAILLGVTIAAVAPAVVVACLVRLRLKGYGVAKGIPTLIVAVAGIDDALSVAGFGIIRSVMFSNDSLLLQILQGPICIGGGIGFGILWGAITSIIPERHDPFAIPLRILMLLTGGLIAVFGSEEIGYSGAGPLACVTSAFVSLCFWSKQGWHVEDNPATISFEIFWMLFEPILFGVTGAQIKFSELSHEVVHFGLMCLIIGVIVRLGAAVLLGIGSKLNLKEKIFVGTAWTAKATVQAALSTSPLSLLSPGDSRRVYAEIFLMVCVLSIILTAPAGAALITIFGPRLLTKTKIPHIPEGWRQSHRPSIRDMSIINEDEEKQEDDQNVEHINGDGVTKSLSLTKLDV